MKIIIIIIILILFFSGKTEKVLSPPGTTHLKENIFIDEELLTGMAWLEYIHYHQRLDSSKTDSLDKRKIEVLVNYKSRKKLYNQILQEISKTEIIDFNSWRSERVNERIQTYEEVTIKGGFCTRLPFIENLKNPEKTIVTYRLPTQEELDYAIEKGIIKKTKYLEITQETVNFKNLDKSKIAFRCVAELIELDE